jgi:hypothetical protein
MLFTRLPHGSGLVPAIWEPTKRRSKLRKNTAVLFFFSCALVVFSSFAFAEQSTQETAPASKASPEQVTDEDVQLLRQDIRSQRKQIVAANLPLTDAEAVKFWPVYDRYVIEHSKIYDTRYALIKEYMQNFNTMTDDQAHSFIKRWTTTEEKMAQLRLRWIPEFEKVLSAKKTVMFFQVDRRLGLLVELKLSSEIPLAKPR